MRIFFSASAAKRSAIPKLKNRTPAITILSIASLLFTFWRAGRRPGYPCVVSQHRSNCYELPLYIGITHRIPLARPDFFVGFFDKGKIIDLVEGQFIFDPA